MTRVECRIRALVMLPVRELAVSVCLSVYSVVCVLQALMSRVECKIRALVMLPVRELAVSVCLSV